ncbi:hypothetical protein QF028_005896 [Neobacillus sp. B4I6]|jgi:hypothetical protein
MLTGWVKALLWNKPGTPYMFEILRISQHSISARQPLYCYDLRKFILLEKLVSVSNNLLVLMLLGKIKVVIFLDNRIHFVWPFQQIS